MEPTIKLFSKESVKNGRTIHPTIIVTSTNYYNGTKVERAVYINFIVLGLNLHPERARDYIKTLYLELYDEALEFAKKESDFIYV